VILASITLPAGDYTSFADHLDDNNGNQWKQRRAQPQEKSGLNTSNNRKKLIDWS
jgi:hypothetical protein